MFSCSTFHWGALTNLRDVDQSSYCSGLGVSVLSLVKTSGTVGCFPKRSLLCTQQNFGQMENLLPSLQLLNMWTAQRMVCCLSLVSPSHSGVFTFSHSILHSAKWNRMPKFTKQCCVKSDIFFLTLLQHCLTFCVKCSTQLHSAVNGWWNIKAQLIIIVPRSAAEVGGWRTHSL